MIISSLKKEQAEEVKQFLINVFGNGVSDLASSYIQSQFSNDFRRPQFFVVCQDNKTVGAAAVTEELFTINTYGISWVSVDANYRRQGIGKRLVESCLSHIKQAANGQPQSIILSTLPGQTGLYERVGFTRAAQDFEQGWIMTKSVL